MRDVYKMAEASPFFNEKNPIKLKQYTFKEEF